MPAYFLDSSAVLKRYVAELGTTWVRSLFDPMRLNRIAVATIAGAEVVAAVTRRARGGGIAGQDASLIISEFRLDLSSDFDLIEVSGGLIDTAMNLAAVYGLRGYDAVQLAAALEFQAACASAGLISTLVSADRELNAAGAAEGLTVDDPNNHP